MYEADHNFISRDEMEKQSTSELKMFDTSAGGGTRQKKQCY